MKKNIRADRDYSKHITFKQAWMQEQYSRLRKVYSKEEVSNEELKDLLVKKYNERRLVEGRLYSNTTQSNEKMTQEQFIDLFLNKPYILSGYSTLYENQDEVINIGSAALKFLLDSRKVFKGKMEESEYGSDQYVYYKILQLTYKVLANSYYGILGQRQSVFYNPHVQNSITMTGQDLTTTAIVAMENFLADNVNFKDLDDILTFVDSILSEKPSKDILGYIDEPKNHKDLFEYFVSKTITLSDKDKDVLNKLLNNLDIERVNRLYYKNKILQFVFDSSYLTNLLDNLTKYKYSETPEEAMITPLEEFRSALIDFCFSDMIFEDRFRRVMKDTRDVIVASDTDSIFINLNNYVIETTQKFHLDKNNKDQQMTVMNVFVNLITEALEKTMDRLTGNMGMLDEFKHIVSMKSEFLYKRMLLTRNKKSYGGLIVAELGRLLNKPVLDIKGLSIKKTTMSKKLRNEFTKILHEDILESDQINLKSIINKFDEIGLEIEESLKKGELVYSIPKSIELFESYKNPSTLEAVRGAIAWNALEPDQTIVPPEKVNLLKLTTIEKDSPGMLSLKNNYPEKYEAIMKAVFNEGVENPVIDISRFGFNVVSLPKDLDRVPDYLIPLIDYKTIVNNNVSNGYILLESLGIYTEEVQTTKYKSNIIEI